MKLVNGPGFPQQLTEWVTPLKSKEIIIISHIDDALTESCWPIKKGCSPHGLLYLLSSKDNKKQIDNNMMEIFVSAKL